MTYSRKGPVLKRLLKHAGYLYLSSVFLKRVSLITNRIQNFCERINLRDLVELLVLLGNMSQILLTELRNITVQQL